MKYVLQQWVGWLAPLSLAGGISCCAQELHATADSPEGAGVKVSEAATPAYKIGLGDVLHVSVWQEPQLSETAVVRPDGKISMPLIYEFTVAGMTPEAAQEEL